MNKNKNIISVGLLFLFLALSGCVSTSNSIQGTYIHNETVEKYINLPENVYESLTVYSDNTFLLKDLNNGIDYSGIVKQQGEDYVFTGTLLTFTGKLVDGNLSTDGGLFIKQR